MVARISAVAISTLPSGARNRVLGFDNLAAPGLNSTGIAQAAGLARPAMRSPTPAEHAPDGATHYVVSVGRRGYIERALDGN